MISIVIPVYKNIEMFLNNLKHNLQFINDKDIIIINDNPAEDISVYLKQFPNIRFVNNEKNLGFGSTVNKAVSMAQNKYVMLLNSDVLLKDDKYSLAVSYFQKDDSLFALSFAQEEKNGERVGKNSIYWSKGLFSHKKASDFTEGINGWAEGGSCIIDKDKFLALDGFDPIYNPFYWEDIDLSYRAWKAGFKTLFLPEILVEHHHESTIGKYFQSSYVKKIAYRNQLLFTWKNITSRKLLLNHLTYLPYYLIYYSVLKGNIEFLSGFFSALQRKSMLKKNNKESKSDIEILNMFV